MTILLLARAAARVAGAWVAIGGRGMAAAFVAAWLGVAAAGRGDQFYVAPGGSNSNPGTAALPWQTLQYAAGEVGPGDRVTVRAGNYRGFYMSARGEAGSPIEFVAEPGVLINLPNSTTGQDGINLEGAWHVVIDGFEVTGMTRAGVRSVGFPEEFAKFVTVRNVYAHDNGNWGIFTGHVDDLLIENNRTSGSTNEHGIYVSNSGDRPVLRGNASWDNHGSGIHMNGDESEGGDGIISGALVSGNLIYNNAVEDEDGMLGGGSGINMDGVQSSRIENNLVYGNHASGISLYSEDGGGGSNNNVVVNNTIHQAADGRWALNIQNGSTGNKVLNNILLTQHESRGALDVSPDSLPGLMSDYNAVVSRFTKDEGDTTLTLGQWQAQTLAAGTPQDVHSIVTTAGALFVNWPEGDYRLKAGAAAVNAGTSLMAPAVDFFGNARPAGAVDMGAIERVGATADFNGDGAVNGTDLTAWRTAFGATAGANADGDADSDGADFLAWQRQHGPAPAAAVTAAVPEPGGLWLALAALAAALGRRVAAPAPAIRQSAKMPVPYQMPLRPRRMS